MRQPLHAELARSIRGDVRFDNLTRTLYSTDASIYEIVPAGVVLPRDRADMVATVNACREAGVSIVPRGGGTGLTGGAVGSGIQLDCARYMTRISDFDVEKRTVGVESGVVLDDLNTFLAPHGLHFAPDVATSSRATIGGMIANNSCGAHSIRYGRTVDHLAEVTVVLSDGSVATWPSNGSESARAERIDGELGRIARTYGEEVGKRFPSVMRRNGGYALDRICGSEGKINPATIVCGSEGTLCAISGAVLKLTPLPACKGVLLVHFKELRDSLAATPVILEHDAAAVELMDRMIVEAARRDPSSSSACRLLDAGAAAILLVEFFGETAGEVEQRLNRLERLLEERKIGYGRRQLLEPAAQESVWNVRRRGLGLLMSQPGDRQPYAFVEDAAVEPARLGEYIERFQRVVAEEGVTEVGYYAHASVGVLHVRPVLNLKRGGDVERMRRIADRVSSLVLEFGGAMTGEHGDGIVRSCWHEKMYGRAIVRAFGEVKRAFDPEGLFNPGKIVDPLPMSENLRFGAEYRSREVKTHLDFGLHGGMAGLAEMCNGNGQCRQRGVGTMCPSFMATGDEKHTTRARANALRVALSNRGLLNGLDDPALAEVMDLCLLCKACKSECPASVDMARLKVEWLSHRNMRDGVPRGARFSAEAPMLAKLGSRFPRLSNLLMQSSPVRALIEWRYGFDRRVRPPRLANFTFRQWLRRHRPECETGRVNDRTVAYFVDTWTNYFTPQVGVAAFKLLEAAGFSVLAPPVVCCGRTFISKGLLTEAKQLADANIETLVRFADTGTPIVGTEPSCILTLVDEYPQLVREDDARAVAGVTKTLDSFLADALRRDPDRISFTDERRRILYHGHCHEKALVGTGDAMAMLNAPPGYTATEIDSGCCGMAGSFGHEKEHYDVAKAIGEERLFPAVRCRGEGEIVVSGFSCRHQITHHTNVSPRHTVEILAEATGWCENRSAARRR